MIRLLKPLDQRLYQLKEIEIFVMAVFGVAITGWIDYRIGHEISISVFYLLPMAIATWYGRQRVGIAIAILSCLSWYIIEDAINHTLSFSSIAVWNTVVRLVFFLIVSWILNLLKTSLRIQQGLAQIDTLTGLYVRREFDARIKHHLALAQRNKGSLTLAYFDVDNFKTVNDTYGHNGGDQVLQAIATALAKSIRMTDTGARLGGDEFALILPNTDSTQAREVIARIGRAFHESPTLANWKITCSIGVVTFVDVIMSPEQVLDTADRMMYQVKHNSKGTVAFNVFKNGAPSQSETPIPA